MVQIKGLNAKTTPAIQRGFALLLIGNTPVEVPYI